MLKKNMSSEDRLRGYYYDEDSFKVFQKRLGSNLTSEEYINLTGWCNYKEGWIIVADLSSHPLLRMQHGLSRDNLYPFSLHILPNTKNVELIYGGDGISEIPAYIKPMIDYIINECVLIPARLTVIGSVVQRLREAVY